MVLMIREVTEMLILIARRPNVGLLTVKNGDDYDDICDH